MLSELIKVKEQPSAKIDVAMPQVAPVLDHQPLDLWGLFRVVAAAGGYQAVSARRY
jgi:ARID/BRIGHT DNA binding domain